MMTVLTLSVDFTGSDMTIPKRPPIQGKEEMNRTRIWMGMMQNICNKGLGFGARLQSRVSLLSISYDEEFPPMNVLSGVVEPAAMCDFSPMLELAPI